MVKITAFQILFDKQSCVFSPSEEITGNVILHLNEPLKCREVRVKFHGSSCVKWKEHSNKHTHTYRSCDDYFHHAFAVYNAVIADTGREGDNVTIPAGRHAYRFMYRLPEHIATSFEGEKGHVRYYSSCTIDISWGFDEKCKRMFTVICPYDLNTMPHLATPLYYEDETTMGCCCCEEGPLRAKVSINKQGYVPGEQIAVSVQMKNKSGTVMDSIYARLDQHTEFDAVCAGLIWDSDKTKFKSREMTPRIYGEPIPANSESSIPDILVPVPACVATELLYSTNIRVRYSLKVKIEPAGLEVHFPITVGTIPLWSHTQYGVVMPSAPPTQPAQPADQPAASAPPPPYPAAAAASALPPPDAPPPSYESCVFGAVDANDDSDDDGQTGPYAPQYPYFNYLQAPTAPPAQTIT